MSLSDYDQKIAVGLTEAIASLWQDELSKDLTVVLDGNRIKCHSFIMCACSQYFRDRLRPERQINLEKNITVTGIDLDIFKLILDLVYTSWADELLTPDNVKKVWDAAELLQISYLVKVCKEYFVKNPSLQNYGDVYEYLKTDTDFSKSHVLKFITKNFETCHRSQAFLNISFDDLYQILKSHGLVARSEDTVLRSISQWVAHVSSSSPGKMSNKYTHGMDLKNRLDCLYPLLHVVRIYAVSKAFLIEMLTAPLIVRNQDAKSLLQDAVSYNHFIDRRHGSWLYGAKYRECFDYVNIWVCVCFDGQALALECYCDGQLYSLPKLPFSMTKIQLIIFDNRLVVMGRDGSSHKWLVCTYQSRVAQWKPVCLLWGEDFKACSCDEYLYFFNTSNQKVTRLRIDKEDSNTTWRLKFKRGEKIIAVMSYLGRVIVFSKTEKKELYETSVHYLDTASQTWCRLDSLPGLATNLVHFKIHKYAFILQNTGHLWFLTLENGQLNFKYLKRIWEPCWEVKGVKCSGSFVTAYGPADPAMSRYTSRSYTICQTPDGSRLNLHLNQTRSLVCTAEAIITRPDSRADTEANCQSHNYYLMPY